MKNKISDLAFFGGSPVFKEVIHVGRPNIPNKKKFLKNVKTILDSRWLSNNGPFLQKFEKSMAEYLGVKNFVAVCNGTLALQLSIRGLDLKGEIIGSFRFL